MTPKAFMKRVEYDPFGGCWLWSGAIQYPTGHGRVYRKDKSTGAHRHAWEMFIGPIPEKCADTGKPIVVMHKCDVTCCVNPVHLVLGTQKQNVHDCVSKGRWRAGDRPLGEKSKVSKLTANVILEINARCKSGEKQRDLAKEYRISKGHVARIALGKTWRHLDGL